MRYKTILVAVTVATSLLVLTGCTKVDLRASDGMSEESVSLQGADSAEIDLLMGPGDLSIAGGARGLMEGEFWYSDSRLEPEIDYRVDDGVGELDIRQGNASSDSFGWFGIWDGAFQNDWVLALGDDVPTKLRVEIGAGNTRLDVGSIMLTDLFIEMGTGRLEVDAANSGALEEFRLKAGAGDIKVGLASGSALRELTVETGAGNIEIDLGGNEWEEDIDVKIDTGVGDLTVIVPSDISVRVNVDTGVGDLKANGFVVDGDTYVNTAFGMGGPRIEVDISHGFGNVILRTD